MNWVKYAKTRLPVLGATVFVAVSLAGSVDSVSGAFPTFGKGAKTEKSATTQSVMQSDGWRDTREIGVFICSATFSLEEIATELRVLSELHTELTRTLDLPEVKERVHVYLFRTEEEWRVYHQQNMKGIPYRQALFMKPDVMIQTRGSRGKIYTYVSPQLEVNLRHEGTHALLMSAYKSQLPIWLDEGLAEYFENAQAPQNHPRWYSETQKRLQSGQLRGMRELEKLVTMRDMVPDAYGDSWAWVSFMLNTSEETREALQEHLRGLNKLFSSSMSRRLEKLGIARDNQLRAYFMPR
ncbi:MAG: hypothetical protein Q4C70_01175 [Planctomycetia bacterium]|nr:hypothetical protein [Planctomycetia bacterium]